VTVHEPANAGEKYRGRNISGGSVDFKGNIVRTNRRIVGIINGCTNEVFSDSSRSTGDTFVVDLEEFSSIMGRGVMPFITPELC
jgi:hypothetical protein